MKNLLFIFVIALLLGLMSCKKEVETDYADAGVARQAWQLFIYERTLDARIIGFVDEKEDSALVERLSREAEEIDTLVVSCLIIEDTRINEPECIYDIK